VRRRTIELALEAASVCVAAAALLIVLRASIEVNGGIHVDLSGARSAVLLLSVAFMVAGSFLFNRSWGSSAEGPEADGADSAVEASEKIAHGSPEREVVLRSPMTEDESRLYEMIAESGGEMLQMNIVSSEVFSKAKVTRLLDKLEKRGLVVRERHGMTNRVRLIR
jgi:uncharacterized membrane protein